MAKKPMNPRPAKAKKAPDTRTQAERFEQFARDHGATEDVLDGALGDKAERLRTEPKPQD